MPDCRSHPFYLNCYTGCMKRTLTIPLQRSLFSIVLSLSIFGFATALVGVFIPLILLKSGAPLWYVAGFYVVYAFLKLLCNYPVVRLIQRYGAHAGLGAGFVCSALQMLSILGYASTGSPMMLVAAAAMLSLANSFLWNSQHIYLSRLLEKATRSSSMATMVIITQILGIIAPLTGGLIGVWLGPGWLLGVALLLILAALIPLRHMGTLASEGAQTKVYYNLSGAPRRDIIANFCFNIETAIGTMLWPVYLAVSVTSFRNIGLISMAAALVTAVVVWYAGHRGDKGHDRSVLSQGAAISSLAHIARLFATATPLITLVSCIYQASLAYMGNAWTSTYYEHAKKGGINYIMNMEIACDVANVVLWSTLLVVILTLGSDYLFGVAFGIAAVAAWGVLLIRRQSTLT
jgi:MFS family permease